MDELFGISMTTIMLVLVALLAVALASVAYVALRNGIMFRLGIRNMPRRMAQSVLIIIGLMLSTLIISAAFTTGDTVNHSLAATSYDLLGHGDEWVQLAGEEEDSPDNIESSMAPDVVAGVLAIADETSGVDGAVPVAMEQVPALNAGARQSEPSVNIIGVDETRMGAFPDVISTTGGGELDVAALGSNEVYLNEAAADDLDARPGDVIQIFVQSQPYELTVVDVVEDKLLTGVGDFDSHDGMVTRLSFVQELFDRPGEANFIVISNDGGVRDGLNLSEDVTAALTDAFTQGGATPAAVEVYDVKRDLVDGSEEAGNVMATFFLILGLFSIAAGMLLIVMIFVMLAAERKSELGMARAVGTKRMHLVQMFLSEGMAYNVLSAAVGTGLGVIVSLAITRVMRHIFAQLDFNIQPYVTMRSLVISYSLGVVLTFLTVTFASWRVSNLNIVRAIRDIPEPTNRRMGWRWLAASLVGIVLGGLLVYTGLNTDLAFPFALGFTIVSACVAVLLRYVGVPERAAFSAMGIVLLVLWGFTAGNRLEFLFGPLNGDIEMFFLSGVAMVAAMTFVLVYNADLALTAVSRAGGVFSGALPILRTAVAYPLANKFRTGMTLAMIGLVIFALTMMSTMNFNFNRLFLADSARGGWDVIVAENPNNPIGDLSQALDAAGSDVAAGFRAVGRIEVAPDTQVREADGTGGFDAYPVFGVDAGFVTGGDVRLSARATGYESDADVWRALDSSDDVAVVDRFTVETGGGIGFDDGGFHISGIEQDAKEFDPVTLVVRSPVTGISRQVRVIGVIELASSASFFGIYVPHDTFRAVFGAPFLTRQLVSLDDPGNAKPVAREIEASLLTTGAQADSIKERIDDSQSTFRNFFRLMQAFMGLGLFVGIAAVGVIAFRTVVERRQQIGMLRALGYKRRTVAISFMLESAFVTFLGIACGVLLAVWLSYFLVTSDEFPSTDVSFAIPWMQIVLFAGLTFVASLVMTYIPAQQAARVPTAEALRYE